MNIYQGVPGPPKRREAELLVESVHGRRREGTNIDLLGKGGPGPSPVGMGSPVGGGIGSLPSAMVPTAPTPAPTPGKVGMGASVLSEKDDEDEAAEPSVSNSHKPGVAQAHLVRSADESIPGSTMSGLMRSGTHSLPAYTTESHFQATEDTHEHYSGEFGQILARHGFQNKGSFRRRIDTMGYGVHTVSVNSYQSPSHRGVIEHVPETGQWEHTGARGNHVYASGRGAESLATQLDSGVTRHHQTSEAEYAVWKLTRRLIKEDWTAWNELRAKSKVADMKGPKPGGDVWLKGKGWLGQKDKTRKTSKTTDKSNVTPKTPKASQGGYRYTIGDQVLKPSPGTGFHGTR